jgi:hypothetical protein
MTRAALKQLLEERAELIAACLLAEQLLASITSLPSDLAPFQNTALGAVRMALARAVLP